MKTRTILPLCMAAMLAAIQPVMAHADPPEVPQIDFTINGAGATFPFPLIDLWRVEYNKEFPDISLNYQSIGSGGGIKQHIERTVNFAASDAPMKQSERDLAPGTIHIPESIGGVVVGYNIPEYPDKGLRLTGDVIADIYLGKITRWDDPRIAELNPDAGLPDKSIVAAHRSDGSGTTFVFTDYLTAVSPEFDKHVGKGKSVPWGDVPDSEAELRASNGNEGVAGIIRSTEYSVGYVELAYAFQTGMAFAYVQNGDGTAFIEPTLESISAASGGVADKLPSGMDDWSGVTLVNAPGADSYPIASFTYLLVYEDISQAVRSYAEAQAVVHLIHWMLTDGQEYSPSLLYVPLSEAVTEVGLQGLSQVRYDGQQVWSHEAAPGYEIPDWIKDNARWWADGLISDSDYIGGLQYLISEGIIKI